MKLLSILVLMVALARPVCWASPISAQEDWSMHTQLEDEDQQEAVAEVVVLEPVDVDVSEMVEEVVSTTRKSTGKATKSTTTTATTTTTTTMKPEEEPEEVEEVAEVIEEVTTTTTRKPAIKTAKATTTMKPVVVEAKPENSEEPTTTKPKASTRKPSSRTRPTSSRRGQSAKTMEDLPVEEEMMAKSTSPASIDTASIAILAPKDFKPTSKPDEEPPKDLMDFLRRRKIERIQATTTVDPFVAILATATPPSTEEPVTFNVDRSTSSGNRFSSGSSKRLPSGSSRRGGARTTTTTTTTEAAAVEVVTSRSRFSPRRGGSNSATTTTAQPILDEPAVETATAKSKLVPKKPAAFRPVGNSILRRKDQTTTTTEAPAVSLSEETDDIELEATTRRPFRRASGRLITARSNGV